MAIPGNFLSPTTESVDPDTSGWTVVQNCSKSLGTGGRNGDGCLLLEATAVGEMQARTTVTYPITPGTLYQVFADASSSDQPELIGIQWLGASGSQISVTWSLTTNESSASWHRVSVAGVAPMSATQARVLLSATAAATGAVSYFENVYLGQPWRTSGNLLSFNTESGGEVDSSGWTAETNATITRDAPVFSWPVDWYYSGGELIKATASSAGDVSITTTEGPTVQPGVEYNGYCHINPPTSTSSCWVELRWLNAGGDVIGTKRSVLASPGAGIYRQIASGIAPSNAASAVLAAGITSATSGQVIRIEGAVIQPTIPQWTGSVMPLEDTDFEAGTGSWTVSSGAAAIARSAPWGAAAQTDFYSLAVTSPTAGASTLVSAEYPVIEGVNWRPILDLRSTTGGAWTASLATHWFDDAGASISTSPPDPASIPADGNFWQLWEDTLAPAGAATGRLEVTLTAPSVSAVLHIDAVGFFQTRAAFEVDPNDELGKATLVLRDLPVGETLTLYRIVDGRQALVRGPQGWISGYSVPSTQATFEDYEAPIGVAFSYRAEFLTSAGTSSGYLVSQPTLLAVPDPSDCWIKDPLQPERNIRVRASIAPDWSRPIEQTEYRIRGRRNSVILSDVRGGLTGTVQVWTMNDTEREALHFALDIGEPMLIQFAQGVGLEDAYYVIGDVTEARFSPVGTVGRRQWSLALTQVDAPVGGIGGTAGWTVQDVLSTWNTAFDVFSSYASILDLALDQRET